MNDPCVLSTVAQKNFTPRGSSHAPVLSGFWIPRTMMLILDSVALFKGSEIPERSAI